MGGSPGLRTELAAGILNCFCPAGRQTPYSGQGRCCSGRGWYCSGHGRYCSGRVRHCSENSSSGLWAAVSGPRRPEEFFSEHLPETSIWLYFPALFHPYWLNYVFYLFKLVIFLSPRTSRLPVPVSLLSLPLLLLIPQLYLGKDSGKNIFFSCSPLFGTLFAH